MENVTRLRFKSVRDYFNQTKDNDDGDDDDDGNKNAVYVPQTPASLGRLVLVPFCLLRAVSRA